MLGDRQVLHIGRIVDSAPTNRDDVVNLYEIAAPLARFKRHGAGIGFLVRTDGCPTSLWALILASREGRDYGES